jgi:hypothetical protein
VQAYVDQVRVGLEVEASADLRRETRSKTADK